MTPEQQVSTAFPQKVLQALKERHSEEVAAAWAHIEAAAQPGLGWELAQKLSDAADHLLGEVRQTVVHNCSLGLEAQALWRTVPILALGGYGRRELCPKSDLDLLFLVDPETQGLDNYINGILYALWDLGFEVGHSVRTIEQCLEVAKEDASVLSSLMDARLLPVVDAQELSHSGFDSFRALQQSLDQLLRKKSLAEAFTKAKLLESDKRNARFGASIYLLEPNVKEGKGGLRTLHFAQWMSQLRWKKATISELLRLGALAPREQKTIYRAYDFLLRVRCELHQVAGRRLDHLRFGEQEKLAARLGYIKEQEPGFEEKKRGVERFMRAYYYHAHQLQLTCEALVERALARPSLKASTARWVNGFKIWQGTLTVAHKKQFRDDPATLMRIFRTAQDEALPIYSYTKELIVAERPRCDRIFRRKAMVVDDFLAFLENGRPDAKYLFLMHDLGILRGLIPEFARVSSRWQHSLYHVYAVDVHSIKVVEELKKLRAGVFREEQPHLTRMAEDMPRPGLLYMAALLHDIGKGWPKLSHSSKGAEIAALVGKRFEESGAERWSAEDTQDLVWLVQDHLLMSDIAQRRDVSDPDLLQDFCEKVDSLERLHMLYLLTFADMRGTSPKVWTSWKAALLQQLFQHATAVMSMQRPGGELDAEQHFANRRERVKKKLSEIVQHKAADLHQGWVDSFMTAAPDRYLLLFGAQRMLRHLRMWRRVSRDGGLATHVRHLRREGVSQLTVLAPDRPGLLAVLAGALASEQIQIASASVFSLPAAAMDEEAELDTASYTWAPGQTSLDSPPQRLAMDFLYVCDAQGNICDSAQRWKTIREVLRQAVWQEIDVETRLQAMQNSGFFSRSRPAVKTEIKLAPGASKKETVLDVFCEDRVGLLYTLAKTIQDLGLTISLAKISTQGHRAADGFYLCDSSTGKKIEDPKRLRLIKQELWQAIE